MKIVHFYYLQSLLYISVTPKKKNLDLQFICTGFGSFRYIFYYRFRTEFLNKYSLITNLLAEISVTVYQQQQIVLLAQESFPFPPV